MRLFNIVKEAVKLVFPDGGEDKAEKVAQLVSYEGLSAKDKAILAAMPQNKWVMSKDVHLDNFDTSNISSDLSRLANQGFIEKRFVSAARNQYKRLIEL